MNLGINGRIALALASTDGLGAAAVRALAADGVQVIVTGRNQAKIDRVLAELPSATGVVMDLADPDSVRSGIGSIRARFDAVDILVLNGPGPTPIAARDLTLPAATAALDTLFFAQQQLIAAFLPGMIEYGWGRIVAIGSSGIVSPIPGLATSNAARAALSGYLKTLAAEVAPAGVTVNTLLPGRIATNRTRALDLAKADRLGVSVETVVADSEASIPAGRYGTPAEFGAAVAFLCSAAASYITGVALRCDGGMVKSL